MNQKSETKSADMKTLKRQINEKGIKSPIGLKKNLQMVIRQIEYMGLGAGVGDDPRMVYLQEISKLSF